MAFFKVITFFFNNIQVKWAVSEQSDSWEPEANVPPFLRERFEKGETEQMVTVWDTTKVYGVTNKRSYSVSASADSPTSKRRKIGTDER